MKQKNVKKLLFTAGVVLMGLGGLKVSQKAIADKEAIVNIEQAKEVLGEIRERLESDTLDPEERRELMMTGRAIRQEIIDWAERLNPRQRAELGISELDDKSKKKKTKTDNMDDVVIIEEIENIDMRPVILDRERNR